MFKKWMKQFTCDHRFYEITRRKSVNTPATYVIVYCPRCDKQKEMLAHQWELIEGRREIREKYGRKEER